MRWRGGNGEAEMERGDTGTDTDTDTDTVTVTDTVTDTKKRKRKGGVKGKGGVRGWIQNTDPMGTGPWQGKGKTFRCSPSASRMPCVRVFFSISLSVPVRFLSRYKRPSRLTFLALSFSFSVLPTFSAFPPRQPATDRRMATYDGTR